MTGNPRRVPVIGGAGYVCLHVAKAMAASGADPEDAIGEDHNLEARLIPLVLEAARRELGRRPRRTQPEVRITDA